MKKLINWFKARNDKQKHLLVGFALGFLYFPFVFVWGVNEALIANLIASSLIFIGKEVYDKYKQNATGFDKVDIFADYLGWGVGVWMATPVVIAIHFLTKL